MDDYEKLICEIAGADEGKVEVLVNELMYDAPEISTYQASTKEE